MPHPLLAALYGDLAPEIITISPRLQAWSAAFSDWLETTIRPKSKRGAVALACRAWASLFACLRCPPWQLDRDRLEHWLEHLGEQGLAEATLQDYRWQISNFLHFASSHPALAADPLFAGRPYHNPFIQAPRSRQAGSYANAYVLRPAEAHALLRAVDRQASLLGRRDYALLLAVLLTGRPDREVRAWQWQDIQKWLPPESGAPDSGAPGPGAPASTASPETIPPPLADAILTYLRLSGRLPVIQPRDYIFAPLANPQEPPNMGPAADPAAWNATRFLGQKRAQALLKMYAAWAGLDTKRVTYTALRHTAALLRMEAGDEVAAIQRFCRRLARQNAHRYMVVVSQMLQRRGRPAFPWSVRRRRPHCGPFRRRPIGAQPGNTHGLQHGYYYHRWLPEDLADAREADAAEPGQLGQPRLDDEIAATRMLMHRMLRLTCQPGSTTDPGRALDLFTRSAVRLANLIQKRQQLQITTHKAEFDSAMDQALKQVWKEFNAQDPASFSPYTQPPGPAKPN